MERVTGERQFEGEVTRKLEWVARKLSGDPELRKDLMQEMLAHFVRVQADKPGHRLPWYVKSCEYHARNYLRRGRSIDSLKRASQGVPLADSEADLCADCYHSATAVDPFDLEGQLVTNDLLHLLLPHLSGRQRQILFMLIQGFGVREVGRQLGISHPAVIKHRRKTACIARELLQDSEGVGVLVAIHNGTNGNGNGGAHA
jgi:RNA polymerase sigma factor (sigma-70 family)